MQLKSILAVVATGLSLVLAEEIETTITSTQTLTKTLTITECNPTATNCPGETQTTIVTTTTWASFPVTNSTSSYEPTGTGSYIPSASYIPSSASSGTIGTGTPSQPTEPAPIVTGGAGGLFVQPAMLLGVVGAGIALLA